MRLTKQASHTRASRPRLQHVGATRLSTSPPGAIHGARDKVEPGTNAAAKEAKPKPKNPRAKPKKPEGEAQKPEGEAQKRGKGEAQKRGKGEAQNAAGTAVGVAKENHAFPRDGVRAADPQ